MSRTHHYFGVAAPALVLSMATALLASCGGGGGGGSNPPSASLSVTPASLTVSAVNTGPTPTALLQASVTSSSNGSFYIGGNYTKNGIASLSSSTSGSVVNITVTFKDPTTLALGTYADTITISACYDQACTQETSGSPASIPVTYTVSLTPAQVYNISPNTATAGGTGFTLTVMGSQFTAQSVVQWGGSPLTTSFVSASQLTAQVTAADLMSEGTVQVTVANGNAVSNATPFVIQPLPALSLTGLSPANTPAGGPDFYVSTVGTGFTASSAITWNGQALSTTYVSGTLLRAPVTAAQIATPGTVQVAVANPASQGGTTSALTLTITPATLDAVAFQLNPAHTGATTFTGVTLPATSLWSANVGGPASYALIVGSLVYVTVSVGGNTQLLALDAKTGAKVWGPIAFAGTANAAYDSGLLFVVNGSSNLVQLIAALDPATGNSKWSATVPGSWFPAPPVAAGGTVYALNGGTGTAFNGGTGAQLWTQGVSGTSGTLAVTADGVYGSAPCTTIDMLPLTGTILWSNNTGCEGGGGDTPVVANGVLYSPISGNYSGITFNAETGAVLGSFAASTLPAVTASTVYQLSAGTLQAIARSNNTVLWSFAGDGSLITAPIVVGGYVFIGGSSGNLYGLDATTGTKVWTQAPGGAIAGNSDGTIGIYTGLSAGDGLLVVPSGNNVTAYQLSTNP